MRKNIKKLAAVGLTAVLGAGLLAGCGGDGKSSGGKTEITFGIWDENQRPAMEQMVEAYEKEHDDVTIKIQLTLQAKITLQNWKLLQLEERPLTYSANVLTLMHM